MGVRRQTFTVLVLSAVFAAVIVQVQAPRERLAGASRALLDVVATPGAPRADELH